MIFQKYKREKLTEYNQLIINQLVLYKEFLLRMFRPKSNTIL